MLDENERAREAVCVNIPCVNTVLAGKTVESEGGYSGQY